ncbi:MAG: putative peptide modification system cyclase [Rhodanobacteraceae bacterium]
MNTGPIPFPVSVARPNQLATPQLRTLVVCDIADSTALVERMGDQNAANMIRKHDRLARALIEQHRGREIDKTDGFLLLFDRPIQAVAFALDYQRGLKHLSAAEGVVLRARVGVHMGDVVIWENAPEDVARGAKPIEVEGLVKPIAARLAQLALPRQILLSSPAAGIARRAQGELGANANAQLHWKEHGRYRLKGLPDSLDVVEVGEEKIAPLHAPPSGRTAKRILPWWRRLATLVAEAALIAIGIGIGAWLYLQSPPALAFANRDWVVVGDLQNLTGQSVFDQSVDSALRISLEQSRYVNVLPELSVQQTLQRMQRDPDKTKVNRAIGSEIALRDGVRALVLPTLAEVGGRVRVTAEVIDPNTQTTVYSISADGSGAQSVLPSLDNVSKQLRGKLGEALASVSKNAQPLDKVATSNLDALRAYSLGNKASDTGNLKDAEAFYRQAIALDPNFALAHIGIAKLLFTSDHNAAAMDELRAVSALHDRLSARDALFASAWLTMFDSPRAALEKWALLSNLYPDFFVAQGNLAYFSWQSANRFEGAIAAATRAASPHNPHRGTSEYLLGALYVGTQHYSDATKHFIEAKMQGVTYQNDYYAFDFAAQRQFVKAATIWAQGKLSGIPIEDIGTQEAHTAFFVDQGRWDEAWKTLTGAKQQAQVIGPRYVRQFDGIELALRSITEAPGKTQIAAIKHYLDSTRSASDATVPIDRADVDFEVLLVAYIAAHAGDTALAKQALSEAGAEARGGDFPMLANMLAVAEAELARASGHPQDAVQRLKPALDGNELCITHVALMDAYADSGDQVAAFNQARWLISHRGRAYVEYNAEQILTPFNVAQSDLAVLNAAEYSRAAANEMVARKYLDDFNKVWPDVTAFSWIATRLQKLQTALAASDATMVR